MLAYEFQLLGREKNLDTLVMITLFFIGNSVA